MRGHYRFFFYRRERVALKQLRQRKGRAIRSQGSKNLTGSEFDDELAGDRKDNVLRGLGGNDILNGLPANDTLAAPAPARSVVALATTR